MTLVSSGAIALSSVNTEMGVASNTLISLNDDPVRNLAGKAGWCIAISMSDLYGKGYGVPAGAFAAKQTMAGFTYANLAYATDGNASTYSTMVANGSSGASYGVYTTAAVTMNSPMRKFTAKVTWSGSITGSGANVFFNYSTNNGVSWVSGTLASKSSSWGTVTDTIVANVTAVTPTNICFYLWINAPQGGVVTVYINSLSVIMEQ